MFHFLGKSYLHPSFAGWKHGNQHHLARCH